MLLQFVFFFNDTATTEIYTLSLHDALPIWRRHRSASPRRVRRAGPRRSRGCSSGGTSSSSERHQASWRAASSESRRDRKSTRLNSSHANISYAVFCLKKKTNLINSVFILPT